MLIYYSKALERSKILLVLITLSVLWGSSFLAIKTVIDVIPPLLAFGIRFAIAGAALLIVHAFIKRHHHEKNEQIGKQHWKDTLIVAAFDNRRWTRIVSLGCAIPVLWNDSTIKFHNPTMGGNNCSTGI